MRQYQQLSSTLKDIKNLHISYRAKDKVINTKRILVTSQTNEQTKKIFLLTNTEANKRTPKANTHMHTNLGIRAYKHEVI